LSFFINYIKVPNKESGKTDITFSRIFPPQVVFWQVMM